jgi:hypothetical protein
MNSFYYTICNGERGYMVCLFDNKIELCTSDDNLKKWKFNKLKHVITNYQHVFIPDGGENSNVVEPGKYKGNTILVKHDKTHYTYIEACDITKFEISDDEILDFKSPIIRSYCVEPYAIGKQNTYLMQCGFIFRIPNNKLLNYSDPYDFYFRSLDPLEKYSGGMWCVENKNEYLERTCLLRKSIGQHNNNDECCCGKISKKKLSVPEKSTHKNKIGSELDFEKSDG